MEKIIVNMDGSAMQFSKTGYMQYLKDSIKGNVLPVDCYNAKYLGYIRYTDDLKNELKIMRDK